MPDAASTLGGTPAEEMAAEAEPDGIGAPPPAPLAETVGAEAGVPLGRSEPYAARFPAGGGPAIIGPGVPADAAAPGTAAACPATGVLAAAGSGAEPEADVGVTSVAAGGGIGV